MIAAVGSVPGRVGDAVIIEGDRENVSRPFDFITIRIKTFHDGFLTVDFRGEKTVTNRGVNAVGGK
ncbi:hypothetical protein D3C85_1607400 [compost metagenome]